MKQMTSSAGKLLGLACMLGASITASFGQTTTQTGNLASQSNTASVPSSAGLPDSGFVKKNIMDNMMEINLSKLALQKSTSKEITAIAQQMVTDHSMILNDLQSYASGHNIRIAGLPGGTTGVQNSMNQHNGNGGMDGSTISTGNGTSNVSTGSGGTTTGSSGVSGTLPKASTNNGTSSSSTNNGMSGSGSTNNSGTIQTDANSPAHSGDRQSNANDTTPQNNMSKSGQKNKKRNSSSQNDNSNNNSSTNGTNSNPGSSSNSNLPSTSTSSQGSSSSSSSANNSSTSNNPSSSTNGTTSAVSGTTTNNGMNANGQSSSGQSNNGNWTGMQGMQDPSGLGNLSGKAFEDQWVAQMLNMHEDKLNELTQASQSLNDTELKTSVMKAIPLIRTHRDALATLKNQNGSKAF